MWVVSGACGVSAVLPVPAHIAARGGAQRAPHGAFLLPHARVQRGEAFLLAQETYPACVKQSTATQAARSCLSKVFCSVYPATGAPPAHAFLVELRPAEPAPSYGNPGAMRLILLMLMSTLLPTLCLSSAETSSSYCHGDVQCSPTHVPKDCSPRSPTPKLK